jgi:ankyrin repeat protein
MNSWSTDENYDRIRKMTNLAVQRSCDPNELVDHQNLLHWLGTLDLSLGLTALSEVCSYLVTIGCELEQKDTWSRTPLLAAAEKTSPDGLVALISKGANLGAVDFLGRGVFHLAFMGWKLQSWLAATQMHWTIPDSLPQITAYGLGCGRRGL